MPTKGECFKKARILLVDDDPDSSELVSHYLADHDMVIKLATSGQEALDAVESFVPDVIVTDVRMPNMTGDTLLSDLHSRGYKKPVLFLTGYDDLGTLLRSYDHGLLGFLQKPIDPEILAAVIRRFARLEFQRRVAEGTIAQLAKIAYSCLPDESEEGLISKARNAAVSIVNAT